MPHGDIPRRRFQFDKDSCDCTHFPVAHNDDGCKLCGCLAGWQRVKKGATMTRISTPTLNAEVN